MRWPVVRLASVSSFLLLLAVLLIVASGGTRMPDPIPAPTATAALTASVGELSVAAPLTLDRTTAVRGETIVGGVTYVNATARPVDVRTIIIAIRSLNGDAASEDVHFAPTADAMTIAPGQRITLVATYTPAGDTGGGPWYAFSSYQDGLGRWHAAPAIYNVGFRIGADGAAAPTATRTPLVVTAAAPDPLAVATPLYWGAYIDGVPWDQARLAAFEDSAGKGASIVHWGQPWWRDGQYQPFYADDFARVRAHGAIPLLDWGSWDYCCGPDQPAFSLAAIIRGDHDAYIRQWATGARDWGHPLFLRFDWEMNGWWSFPWSEQTNGNQPGDYVRAWRHVHDLFAQVGATNVTWVWCVNVIGNGTTPLADLYPGDAYVDWVAMDGFNWGAEYGNIWQTFTAIFAPTYAALRQLAPAKPIMIAEIASVEQGGDKAAWIREALGPDLALRFPAIKAVVWFNWNDDDAALTWPIESAAATEAAFGEAVGGTDRYLPNRFGELVASPIPPPAPARRQP